MLKAGCIILTIEEGFQFIVSVLSLAASIIGKYAPILKMTLTDEQINTIDPQALTTTKALAIMHNSGAILCTFLVLVLVWTGLSHGYKWAFAVLLIAGIFGHAFWFIGDSYIGNKTIIINAILSALFLAGIGIAGYGIFRG